MGLYIVAMTLLRLLNTISVEPQVQSQLNPCGNNGGQIRTAAAFSPNSLCFTLLTTIAPLLHIY